MAERFTKAEAARVLRYLQQYEALEHQAIGPEDWIALKYGFGTAKARRWIEAATRHAAQAQRPGSGG